uniref:Receptor-like protein kinase ANXUR1 n=1 Tax=Tanacetum cinerariifolium TaxID=118510 RepID=A0A6L2L1X4_TANCI|nr:receptor-like protein kinase ANXUR1 [Tanacetum cinerariifolium]
MSFLTEVEHLQIPLQDIYSATSNFSEKNFIASGGFGKVYQGQSDKLGMVAIKRLDRKHEQGDREFMMEIALLSTYKHENIVSLVGFSNKDGEKILVYKHERNGSLDKYLHRKDLTWIQCLQICIDAAHGLKYLHHNVGLQHRIIHLDIKSSNILLDENWRAKISDFGLSKVGPANVQHTFLISQACGTIGYIDPEYLDTGVLTKESDVYSFGVVLFKVLCGRPARVMDERQYLNTLAQIHYEKETLVELIPSDFLKQINTASLSTFSKIAYKCLRKHRQDRPTMTLVVEELEEALNYQLASSGSGPIVHNFVEHREENNLTHSDMRIQQTRLPTSSFSHSTLASSKSWSHNVFLSFRGEDDIRGQVVKAIFYGVDSLLQMPEEIQNYGEAISKLELMNDRKVGSWRNAMMNASNLSGWVPKYFANGFEQKSLANKLQLKDRLYTFRMKPRTSVQDHLDEFNTILIDLKNLDVDIDDEDKAVLLVISLPASYKHFKEIMLYGNRETLSFDDVKSALLSKQKYDDDVEPEGGEGLVARGRSKGNNEKKPEKAAEVAIAKGDSGGDVYLAIDTEKYRDELIVDSGCTIHDHYGGLTAPDLKRNLISLSTLEANECTIVYSTAGVATSKASLDDSKLWHYRLGHMGEKGMKNLAKKGLIKVSCNLEFCEHCVFGKQKRVSFSPGIHRTRDALDYIHFDLRGPSPVTSRGGKRYTLTIIDDFSRKIKKLRTDNGLEFCGESFNALCRKYGIARHHTLVKTPQQNGVAERMNRTIMEKVRCMLSHANLDKDFWVEAATTVTYLINRSSHRSLDGNIPEILWSGNCVDYSNLRVFGCLVYAHVNEGKLVPCAVKCIFLGYSSGVKGYRVWCPDPKYRKIIHSRDVTFNEDVIISSGKDFVLPNNVDKIIQKVKDGILGVESNRYKARYVVRGFDQREGIDFNEVFSLVVRHTSIRVLLSIVALQDLELKQLDVKTTFLHGYLKEEIYVEQPEGFKVPGKEDHVCRLKKSLYGLKQSPRQCCKPVPTPLAPYFKLSSHECPKYEEDKEDIIRVKDLQESKDPQVPVAPTTAEQRLARKNKLKARGTLLMALLDKHQLKFNTHKDAKTLMGEIEKRFGGNTETKKVQKTLLKQQYENFTGSSSESLDQIHDRVQKLISQLKILRRNKTYLKEQSLDDLFNILKIYEDEVKSSSSVSTSTQNIAFVSSSNTDSTNEPVSAATSVSVSAKIHVSTLPNVDSLSNALIYLFFASQSNSPQLDKDDLKQIDANDLEEMDLKWKMAMLTVRARRFLQRTVRNLGANGPTSMGFDMSKVESITRVFKQMRNLPTMLSWISLLQVLFLTMSDDYLSSGSDESLPPSPIYDRYQSGNGYHDVPPPYTGTFMPPKPDLVFNNAPNDVKIDHPTFNVKISPTKPDNDLSHTHRPSAPIIEDWVSDSKDESETKTPQNVPSFVLSTKQVKYPRPSVQHVATSIPTANSKTAIPKPTSNGKRRNRKACFMGKSLDYLIKDSVLSQSKLVPITTVRPVTTAVPKLSVTRPRHAKTVVTKTNSPPRRHINRSPSPKASNFSPKVTVVKAPMVNAAQGVQGKWEWKPNCPILDHGNPQHALKDKGVIDSGCSRYMTRNMSYLSDFEELNGGYVTFGGNPKGGKISGKGKIRTGKLDFDDVYFVKELKFNLFIVSQMYDKKNSVLFTDTDCLVLSPEFKLPDENQVLLKVPRETICTMLGHINFKTMNKLVKGNLVRGLPSKVFKNDNICVACKKGKQHRASYSLGKFDGKVDEGFLVGYSVSSKAFRVFNSRTRIVQETLHVNFLENKPNVAGNQSNPSAGVQEQFDSKKAGEESDQQYVLFPVWSSDITYFDDEDDVGAEADFNNLETSITVSPILTTRVHKDHPVTQIIGDLSLAMQTRSMTRVAKDQGGLSQINNDDFHTCVFACFLSQEEPKRVHHAFKDSSWIQAMQEELLQFKMQKVWVLVDLPHGKRDIGTKWVFRNKKDERGIVVRNKARLVTQGHTQEEGIDYEEVFPPVARMKAIRLFLAYASFMGFMVYQMDVKSAFLYETIEEEVYVCQPLGFEDPDYPDKIYVDDIIFGSTNKDLCKPFEKLMKDKFQMSSMGELTFFLGLQVKQKKDRIFISQDKYVAKILRKFRLTDGKSASTPIDTEKPLLKDLDAEDVDVHTYRSMIGSLMYLTSSRPDIMFAVCQTVVTTSFTEAEYVAATNCCAQVLWI